MSKFSSFAEYPHSSLESAEAGLLTVWATLERYHNELVLVGGLAVRYLTKPAEGWLPGPVTMDVDLGVTLAAEGGQYGTIADDLAGQGFEKNKEHRFVKNVGNIPVYIDFLTEHPSKLTGTAHVDGVEAGVFPGIARALATKQPLRVSGKDVFGAMQEATIFVTGIGPLLVLKLNAFASRQQPKDAYDVVLATSQHSEGATRAVTAFQVEKVSGNRGYARAEAALAKYFSEPDQSGPLRCAEFILAGAGNNEDAEIRRRQIIEQTITVGRALLGA